jgi:hypothetical protein
MGVAYPCPQLGWIRFCIDLFEELLALGHARLADAAPPIGPPPAGQYWLAECFPTWTWREFGLSSLPGKARRPDTAPYLARLRLAFALPQLPECPSHDDLQGLVAAVVAAALAGGPAIATVYGVPSSVVSGHLVECRIWSARPLGSPAAAPGPGTEERSLAPIDLPTAVASALSA